MYRALLVSCLVLANLSALGCASASVSAPGSAFPPGTVERMNRAVFELVVPQFGDGNVTYTEPLPFNLVPYAQRTDKFRGLGTAFAISPHRFVSAAHVFNAYERQPFDKIYLRDATGKVHEIGDIVRYSQYRDLVEFEVVDPPADVAPLEVRTSIAVGDVVDTVGNAGGEGIVIRTGAVTSFVPEEIDGRWKFIRFTSPASHGNSGGPLVDSEGRVVGVVVRAGAAENLNVAVPIDELAKLGTTQTEFVVRGGLSVGVGGQQRPGDWRFASPLPTTYPQLLATVRADLRATADRQLAEIHAQTAKQSFPGDPAVLPFLREVSSSPPLGTYARDAQGRWTVNAVVYKEAPLNGGGALRIHATDDRFGVFLFDKPTETPLASYLKRPTLVADIFAHARGLSVPFAGRKIPIASLGAPQIDERWTDAYGRPWLSYVWQIPRAGESLVFDCLAVPSGLACRWGHVPVALEEGMRLGFKLLAVSTTVDYRGTFAEWEDYLALPRTVRSRVLDHTKVHAGKSVAFNVGPFAGNVELEGLSRTSLLTVLTSVDPVALTRERVFGIRLVAEKGKLVTYGVDEELAPVAGSGTHHSEMWKKLGEQKAPYNGDARADGKTNVASGLLQRGIPNKDKRVMYFCRAPVDDAKAALETKCAQFRASLKAPVVAKEEP